MKSTTGWLVDAQGNSVRAKRYRFGAVPIEQSPRFQIPTVLDVDVAGAALPGVWAAVVCIYAGIASSAVWFLGVPVSLIAAYYGVILLSIMRSRACAREIRPLFRFSRASALCPANAYLQAAAESLELAPSRTSSKAWNALAVAANELTSAALFVDAADTQIAALHDAQDSGDLSMEEYRVRAWEPWVRANPHREAIARFTQDCQQVAVTASARANVAAMRTGTPRVVAAPLTTPTPVGAHLRDFFG